MVASAGFMGGGLVPKLPSIPRRKGGRSASSARGAAEETDGEEAAAATSARIFRRVGGGFEQTDADGTPIPRAPSPRRPDPVPRPPSRLFGVGTQGLGGGCNESLEHFEKVQRRRWLDLRLRQIAVSAASAAAARPTSTSPLERVQADKQQKLREREQREEDTDKRNSQLAGEHKRRKELVSVMRSGHRELTQQVVSERREKIRSGRRHAWQYFSDAAGVWIDFSPEQTEVLERAVAEGRSFAEVPVPSVDKLPDASLVADVQGLSAEIRTGSTSHHMAIRRRLVVPCPQNGLGRAGRAADVSQRRRVSTALREQRGEEVAARGAAARDAIQERKELWDKIREMRKAEQRKESDARRQQIKRDRDRQQQRWDHTQRSRHDWNESQKNSIQEWRRAKEAQREQARQGKEMELEQRMKELRKQRASDRSRRQMFDTAAMDTLRQELTTLRTQRAAALQESKARCQEAAPLQDGSVTLSRAQWHSRAANLSGVRTQRERRMEAVTARDEHRVEERRRCAELHDSVVDGVSRRRAKGIAGGGAGFGPRTGGIVVVSPPRRRSAQHDEVDEDD
eukprot:TRINITY_DN1050_c7_g1_i1.p1 TRINITY_DN1050_c7_g1~~TRINITY_DN1050_c7_g1_i1.p1  ORF type:complete len:587 (+),score=251.89 TRINITY_DN1050_c7_g1_i1:60-1763(+)